MSAASPGCDRRCVTQRLSAPSRLDRLDVVLSDALSKELLDRVSVCDPNVVAGSEALDRLDQSRVAWSFPPEERGMPPPIVNRTLTPFNEPERWPLGFDVSD